MSRAMTRTSSIAMVGLALIALGAVLTGYTQPRLPDECTLAHIFQLSIVLLLPTTLLFLTTADWRRPARSARPLAIAGAATVLAFAALYVLEHAL